MIKRYVIRALIFFLANAHLSLLAASTHKPKVAPEPTPVEKSRRVMFIGMDISGSFMGKWLYDDAIRFASHYMYGHLHALGGLEVPSQLFVGSIGGASLNEAKTFYPIQTFEYSSVGEIEKKLREIFPKNKQNPFTDFNAFFEQIATFVRNKKLILRPIEIVMFSDGEPDAPSGSQKKQDFRALNVKSLENLSRDVTIRVLYTSAVVGMDWQTKVPRDRVKIWTQDADVMRAWSDKKIMQPSLPFEKQSRFFDWLKDNVNFNVPRKRVD